MQQDDEFNTNNGPTNNDFWVPEDDNEEDYEFALIDRYDSNAKLKPKLLISTGDCLHHAMKYGIGLENLPKRTKLKS